MAEDPIISHIPDDFAGKRVVVTGGTRGIGLAVVERLADAGAVVVAVARRGAAGLPQGVRVVTGDLSTADGVDAAAASCLSMLGGLDVLVNNAGAFTLHMQGPLSIPDQEWVAALDLNYLSAVRMDRAMLPELMRSRGVIVQMSSISSTTPAGATLHYAAAKAALTTYAKGLSRAIAADGVRVNSVVPGTIGTDPIKEMIHNMASAMEVDEEEALRAVVGDVPLGGPGRAGQVAELVAFLASNRAAWITGATFVIDGGQSQVVR